ncbi:MAG: CRTAC1 family protein [Gemmatimonadetes bacterium]|jgi:enediyne biosynthesis protein E4|nr:CRTAC1 family protein [Gemmatimonadota bacterium]MBT6147247.1 CRTAC1 family protein [Gemmatimonadota bacterium]MBT7860080.1 CRTAC1 family protein [Gemmatimonadota bacterium]
MVSRTLRTESLLLLLALVAMLACRDGRSASRDGNAWPQFVDIAAEAGVTVPVCGGSPRKGDILEANTGGVAILDYDGDGDRDLFFVNGGPQVSDTKPDPRAILYRNDGGGHFTDVSEQARVDVHSWGMGVAVWDVDGDAWPDIYLSAWGHNRLLRNRGDGTFESVAGAGGADDERWSSGIAAADYDLDGDVDLYLAQYVDRPADLPIDTQPPCTWRGIAAFCGPAGMLPAPDRLFERTWDADAFFADVTEVALGQRPAGYGLGAVAHDLDDDGDQDLYVANDATPNYLYRNHTVHGHLTHGQGRWQGRLEEIGAAASVSASQDGRNQAGMGIAIGDVDGDGTQDLLVSNFSHDHVSLYRQTQAPMQFREMAFGSDLGRRTLATLGWGTGFADFDLDGDLDLFVANGHVYPQVDAAGIGTTYRQANQVFRNEQGYLRDHSSSSGPGFNSVASSRGAALGDIDDDGDVDIAVVNLDTIPGLLRNDSHAAGWLTLQLRGPRRNRSAIGTRVRVELPDGRVMRRQVGAGTGYLSQDDHRLHFGTDRADSVNVEIGWPDGRWQKIGRVVVDQHLQFSDSEDRSITEAGH